MNTQHERVLADLLDDAQERLARIHQLSAHQAELAHRVRTTIFRRYWQQGGEMSEQVVAETLAEHGLAEPEPEPDHLAELTRWWKAALDRVPCMLAPTGVVHRGLQDVQAVRSFVNSALHSAGEGPGCR